MQLVKRTRSQNNGTPCCIVVGNKIQCKGSIVNIHFHPLGQHKTLNPSRTVTFSYSESSCTISRNLRRFQQTDNNSLTIQVRSTINTMTQLFKRRY